MKPFGTRIGIALVILAAMLLFCIGVTAEDLLSFPDLTETDCEWNLTGNLICETAHDLDGTPALNSRGFSRADYTYDEHSNLTIEAYYDTNGKPIVIDTGYARA